ncbi:LiaI-LiaF-like domain-containing protein [Duganella sp. CT11-25]|uniref:LiaI-LiaF-like domain-containing protein n=1 Tax=unclassified Duganella TaxID=2636909 RepID=UPI0039AEEBA0
MSTNSQTNPATQVIIGLFVIVVGLLFLLDNLGWVDLDFRLHVWPTALMFFGVLKLVQTRTRSGMIVGGALVAIGGLVLLKETGLIYISWRTLWPVLMIVAGVAVVFKSTGGRSMFDTFGKTIDKDGNDPAINITSIMGAYKNRITTPDFRGGEVTTVMGGCDLDLRQSSINGDAVLNVFSLFGGITIKVPIDWAVQLEGTPIMGGFEEKTVPPATSGKRLIIRGYVIMGGLEVRN